MQLSGKCYLYAYPQNKETGDLFMTLKNKLRIVEKNIEMNTAQ